MLKIPNDTIRHCYQRATECRQKAMRSRSPSYRQDMFDMEERWLGLAHSYELTESLSDFGADVRRHLGKK